VVEITKDGETYTLKTTTTIKNSEIKFELGKEFEEARMDGKTVKVSLILI
jgi:cellular retinoic acid-binding protein 2